MERVIDCPICYDVDACFEEMQKEFNSYMCFNCGFMSSSVYTEENIHQVENTAKLVEELKFFDEERELYWFPSILNMGAQGMIYPEPMDDDLDITWSSYVWKYAKVVDVPEGKEANYNGHKQYLDVENASTFKKEEFLDACVSMGIVQLDAFNG